MKLNELLAAIAPDAASVPSAEISHLTENSRECHFQALFVCIKGFRSDGHRYAKDAYDRGCRAFVAQNAIALPQDAFVYYMEDSHRALGVLACAFYGSPSRQIPVIGITGTKGKTTVACMIRDILQKNGVSCGYIGTNGVDYGSIHEETVNTTPDAVTLQKSLRRMVDFGCRAAVLEVSSQALMLERVAGTQFSCTVYTNLFSDHIGDGEHRDFEDYKSYKLKLFSDFGAKTMVYLASDAHANEFRTVSTAEKKISCALGETADYHGTRPSPIRYGNRLGIRFELNHGDGALSCRIPLIGNGNAENALLAMAVAKECFGIPPKSSAAALETIEIAGRSEVVALENGGLAVIDYAHNGESLRQLLVHLRAFAPRRLICLFGSVGDRTELRRRELGCAAAEHADLCIITSDNPGEEDPQKILDEIAATVSAYQTPYRCFVQREEAIRYALEITRTGDVLVLAGKGHETYQLINGKKIPFSEREILLSKPIRF